MNLPPTALILLSLLSVSDAGKILVYSPLFGHSHSNFLGTIADTLVEAGHDVTVLVPVIDSALLPHHGVRKAKVVIIDSDPRTEAMQSEARSAGGTMSHLWTIEPSPVDMMGMVEKLSHMYAWQCEAVLNSSSTLHRLRQERFDLAILEPFVDMCGFGVFQLLGVSNHASASSGILLDRVSQAIGVPVLPSYVPASMGTTDDKMTFVERAKNAMLSVVSANIFQKIETMEEDLIRQKIADYEGTTEAIAKSSFVFTNANPLLDFPHPVIHKVIEIGGITVPSVKPLDKLYDDVLNKHKHTVFISFGSVNKAMHMPVEYRNALINVFRSLPDVQFIWKYEDPKAIEHLVSDNVMLTEWAPQTDLLADPRLSLFITRAGLGSVNECAFRGKPALVVPIFGD